MGDVTRVAKEAIEAPRVVRVFNAQDYQAGMFEQVIEHNRRSHMKLMFTKGLSNPVVQTIAALGLAVVLYLATLEAIRGQHDGGRVHVVHRGADADHGAAAPPGERRGSAAAGHRGRAEHLRGARHAAWSRQAGSVPIERARGEVEYRDVRFSYPGVVDRRAARGELQRCVPARPWPSSGARAAASPRS